LSLGAHKRGWIREQQAFREEWKMRRLPWKKIQFPNWPRAHEAIARHVVFCSSGK
jgi:hypothetical protein